MATHRVMFTFTVTGTVARVLMPLDSNNNYYFDVTVHTALLIMYAT